MYQAKTYAIREAFHRKFSLDVSLFDCDTLRRAEMTLHRWAEGECGDSNDYASWCLVRDDDGKTYRETYPHTATRSTRTRIADRETGALKRVAAVCGRHGLAFYQQGDPRGCALYVAPAMAGMNDTNYPSVGLAISAP